MANKIRKGLDEKLPSLCEIMRQIYSKRDKFPVVVPLRSYYTAARLLSGPSYEDLILSRMDEDMARCSALFSQLGKAECILKSFLFCIEHNVVLAGITNR